MISTHNQRNYLLFALAILVKLNLTLHSVSSACFYPNASSIPTLVAKHAPPGAWDAFRNFTGCSLGKTYDGLSKLKNYFQHFGYIPNAPPSNFSDVLESAVRAYQKNFNLNVTGKLDEATMNQLARPRCGVADTINGTTSMNSGKSNTNDTLKSHTVAHYSFFTDQSRWPAGTKELTYAFDPEQNLDGVTKKVFANAFDKWTLVRGRSCYVPYDIDANEEGGAFER